MEVVVYTDSLYIYAQVYRALSRAGWKVYWKEGQGLALAGLDWLEKGEVLVWTTPWGLRAYDPKGTVFLTRRDDPKTLALGLEARALSLYQGRVGLRLLPGEQAVLLAAGWGVPLKAGPMARALGLPRDRVRFFLKSVVNKFGLGEEDLVRLARHQVQVMGFKDHLKPLPGAQVQPGLDMPGKQDLQSDGSLEHAPVGEAFRVKAYQHAL